MIKNICIKECEGYRLGSFKFKIGDIVEHVQSLNNPGKVSEVAYFNNQLCLIDMYDFKECFIAIAEWRDKQINSILYDDTEGE